MALITRRAALAGAALSAPTVLASTIAGARAVRAQSAGPIRIGFAGAVSGPFAIIGNDIRAGCDLAVAHVNATGGVMGRPVELVVRDTKANPTEAVAVVREMLSDGIRHITGGAFGFEALAQAPIVQDAGGIYIVNGTQNMPVTHEGYRPCMFRISDNDVEGTRALVQMAIDRYAHITDWAYFGIDSETNNASGRLFQKLLTEESAARGRKVNVLDPLVIKAGSGDGKNQISSIMASPTQGIYSIMYGADGITVYNQARAFGFNDKIKVILDKGNEISFAKAMKRNVPRNFWCYTPWYHGAYRDNPLSRMLYDGWVARTGDKYPQGYLGFGSSAVFTLTDAMKAARSTDPAALIGALEGGLVVETAKGKARFRREDHQIMADINFIEFAPADEEPGFRIADSAVYDGGKMLEPATPGVAFKF